MSTMSPATSLLLLLLASGLLASEEEEEEETDDNRYIFYDVNPGEGFNLRRDVFMRVAVLVKKLNELGRGRFVLVLPPWGGLYHWQTRELGRQTRIPWRDFFDVGSISRFVPAVDLEEYLARHEPVLDEVLYLQRYKEGWNAGEFVEKRDFRECIDPPRYRREEDGTGLYRGWFWDHGEVRARRFRCLSVQGSAWSIKDLVLELLPGPGSTLMLDRAEQVLHDFFGDENYWSARRSMRFAPRLVESADAFRRQRLHSDDRRDGTRLADRWEDQRPERSPERGGDYLCLHLRRKDYVRSRQGQIPSLEGAAEQARRKMGELGLRRAFVATDAPEEEFRRFGRALAEGGREDQPLEAVRFEPDWETLRAFGDGGVAIVDQIICSRAKFFLGSAESTFTFRIQEEREILGLEPSSTFNMLCPDGKFDCEKPSQWKIKYPPPEKKRDEL